MLLFFFSFCPSEALCSHVRPWPAESLSREVNHLAISVSEAPCSPDDSSADWPNWTPVYGAITRHCFLYGTQIVVLGAVACRRQYPCGLARCAGFDSLLTYPAFWSLFISDKQQEEEMCPCGGYVMWYDVSNHKAAKPQHQIHSLETNSLQYSLVMANWVVIWLMPDIFSHDTVV